MQAARMYTNNTDGDIDVYRQLHRAFLVDTQLAKQMNSSHTYWIDLIHHAYPRFVFPLGVLFNILQIVVCRTSKELKNRTIKVYIHLFSVNNLLLLCLYLFNFISYNATSLTSYNRYTCKVFSYAIRISTTFYSWLYVLTMYFFLNCFKVGRHMPKNTRPSRFFNCFNSFIKRIVIVFIGLLFIYSSDLFLMDQIEFKLNGTRYTRCGVDTDRERLHLILFINYLVDFLVVCAIPFLFTVKKILATVHKLQIKADKLAELTGGKQNNSDGVETTTTSTIKPSSLYLMSPRLARIFIFRLIIFIFFISPLFLLLLAYAIWPLSIETYELVFTVLSFLYLLSITLLIFFLAICINRYYRSQFVHLFYTMPLFWITKCRLKPGIFSR